MGNDYQLKKVYEQMVKGAVTPSTPQKPRTLKEAYETKLVTERTAFYALDMNTGTVPPVYNSLKSLGVLEDEDSKHVKSRILSDTIKDVTVNLLTAAGWKEDNQILNSRKLGSMLFYNEIELDDINNIVLNKSQLTTASPTENSEIFNLIEKVYGGVEKVAKPTVKTKKQNFLNMFKKLLVRAGKIGGTDVGPGEFFLSLFTNATKSTTKGDLVFGNDLVEVKDGTTGAALGYAVNTQPANVNAAIDALITKEYKTNKEFLTIKKSFENYIENLKETSPIAAGKASPFTELFFTKLEELIPFIVSGDAPQFLNKAQQLLFINFAKKYSKEDFVLLLEKYKKEKFVNINEIDLQDSTNQILKNLLVINDTSLKAKINDFAKAINKKTSLASTPVSSVKPKSEETLAKKFKEFLLWSNVQATPEQLAQVIYATRPNETSAPDLLSGITHALTQGYATRLSKHDDKALQGLLFATHISEYAIKEDFKYMLLFNTQSQNALYIPAKTSFIDLLNFFEEHKDDLTLKVVFGGQRGAHSLSLTR